MGMERMMLTRRAYQRPFVMVALLLMLMLPLWQQRTERLRGRTLPKGRSRRTDGGDGGGRTTGVRGGAIGTPGPVLLQRRGRGMHQHTFFPVDVCLGPEGNENTWGSFLRANRRGIEKYKKTLDT
jgi:hypothetical protein